MLNLGFDEKLSSRLSSSYPVTSTTLTECSLEIFLAANSSYYVELLGPFNTVGTSGSKLGLYYTGEFITDNDSMCIIRPEVSGTKTFPISAASATEDTTPENIHYYVGSIRTSTSGRLYVKVAKINGADDDFPLLAGACLVARRL